MIKIELRAFGTTIRKPIKKWQVTYIAPLQPFILAAFLPWGGSTGAGRIRLAGAKVFICLFSNKKRRLVFFKKTRRL